MSFSTDAARWRALSTRDPTANGHFLYTVKTTNIYCRPTCPARLARRANIGFCATPAEAEAAGYRPCKRCKPSEIPTGDPQDKVVAKACRLVEESVERGDGKAIRLQDLAKNVGLTPRYFHKVFKDRVGLTPKEYARARMKGAGGGGGDPFLHEALTDLAPWNCESFNFEDLVDFDFDPGLSAGNNSPSAPSESGGTDGMGSGLDMNMRAASMSDLRPDISTIGSGNLNTLLQGIEGPLVDPMWPAATSVFEADAALLLRENTLLGPNKSMGKNTLTLDAL